MKSAHSRTLGPPVRSRAGANAAAGRGERECDGGRRRQPSSRAMSRLGRTRRPCIAGASVRETPGTGGGDGRHVPGGPARALRLELPSSAFSCPPRLQLRAAAAPGLVWSGLAGSTGGSTGSLDLTGCIGALGRGRDRRVDHLASALPHGSRGRCVRVFLDDPAADMPPAEIVSVRLVSIRVDAPIVEAQRDDLSQRYRGVRLRHGPR